MTAAREWEKRHRKVSLLIAMDQLWQKTAHIPVHLLEFRINFRWLFPWLSKREKSQAPENSRSLHFFTHELANLPPTASPRELTLLLCGLSAPIPGLAPLHLLPPSLSIANENHFRIVCIFLPCIWCIKTLAKLWETMCCLPHLALLLVV